MSRQRAADHDQKRKAILDHAAGLFAVRGFAGTSMADIAASCGTSKALLYHYYANKEQLLFDLLKDHFERLEVVVVSADDPFASPRLRLRALVRALLDAYEGANALHKVQINDMPTLPSARQQELKQYERRLVSVFAAALAGINPALSRGGRLSKPVTMALFGMVNWHYLWFRPDGPVSRRQYADLVTRLIIGGAADLNTSDLAAPRRRTRQRALAE